MNAVRFGLSFLTLLLFMSSCQEDLDLVNDNSSQGQFNSAFPNADERLWPFFQNFEKEAHAQGLDIDLVQEGIRGEISPIDEANVAGVCSYGGFSPGRIVIDTDFWARANVNAKEMIVFHELGHCYLFRDHREGRTPNGSCVSIMRSGVERCRDNYHEGTKPYYLEELFSVNNRGF